MKFLLLCLILFFSHSLMVNAETNYLKDKYIIINNYPKKLKLYSLFTGFMRSNIFFKNYATDKTYSNGYFKFKSPRNSSSTKITTAKMKNAIEVENTREIYYFTVVDNQCYISKNNEDWEKFTIRFIKEENYPYNHPYEWQKIWVVNLKSKYFEGEYVLPITPHSFAEEE
jgi:hypothetical protein